MSIIFFFGLLIGTILLVTAPEGDKSRKWLAFCNYCASAGAFADVLRDDAIPGLERMNAGNLLIESVRFASVQLQFWGQVLAPFVCTMYALAFTKAGESPRWKRWIPWLIAPVGLTAVLAFPEFRVNFKLLLVWCTPYYAAATYLMVRAWQSETNRAARKSKLQALVIVVPLWLGVYFLNNIPRAVDLDSSVYLLILPAVFGTGYLLFVSYIFLSGVFGLKVKVEEQVLDRSLQIMSSGTAVLNHTIKNEIHKIKFFFLIAQEAMEAGRPEEADGALRSAIPAIEHIDNMVDRIKSQTEQIVLKERTFLLNGMVRSAVAGVEAMAEAKGIRFDVEAGEELALMGDEVLLGEAVKNIINNAMEAIQQKGSGEGHIRIRLNRVKTEVWLEIRDDGVGIPESEQLRVLEPFYSTKKNPRNHGLGLSFAYNVMKAHQGSVSIESTEGAGTTVVLRFSKKALALSPD